MRKSRKKAGRVQKKPSKDRALDMLYRHFSRMVKKLVGYPAAHFFDYSSLFRFLKFHINNIGDPFQGPGNFQLNTLVIEREVIDRFAELFHAPKNEYWGYVTHGGTEGNLHGLYVARECHPEGVVFFSDQTHYSIPKILKLLRMPSIVVPSMPNGEIDYHHLRCALIKEKGGLNRPPIIVATIGTTMKGAIDDIVSIQAMLEDLKIKDRYLHCDAAFFGMILPFLPECEVQPFDFRSGVDSIAISGHKLIGTPFPCGVIISKKIHVAKASAPIEYVGIKDTTISGSRNGVSPLFLWFELDSAYKDKFQKTIRECMKKADYAVQRFQALGVDAWRNKNSIIVIFPKPSQKTITQWQLATEGDIAHMITLQHVSRKMIDSVVAHVAADLRRQNRNRCS